MNYMKKQDLLKIRKLSKNIGHFIRYWGFRQIHGEIWALVYLSEKPLSGIEIGEILMVSKALISPALKELEAEGLIKRAPSENSKTKRYQAEEDVVPIIHGVLKRREQPMMNQIFESYEDLKNSPPEEGALKPERLEKMGKMIQMGQMGLFTLLSMADIGEDL